MNAAVPVALAGFGVGGFLFVVGITSAGRVPVRADDPPPQVTESFTQITVPRPRITTPTTASTTTTYPLVVTLPDTPILTPGDPLAGQVQQPPVTHRELPTRTTVQALLIAPVAEQTATTPPAPPAQTVAGTSPPATTSPPPTDPPVTDPPSTEPPPTEPPVTDPPPTDPPPTDPPVTPLALLENHVVPGS